MKNQEREERVGVKEVEVVGEEEEVEESEWWKRAVVVGSWADISSACC